MNGGTIPERVARCAAADPGALAVAGSAGSLSYGALLARADGVAGLLLARGARPGDVVGVCLERCPWLVAALLGVHRSGCAYLPLDPQYPAGRLRFMLEDCAAAAVLSVPGLLSPAAAGPVPVLDVRTAEKATLVAGTLPPVSPGDLAYIIYTSGSTGTPKGVAIEHASAARLFDSVGTRIPLSQHDVWSWFHSVAFDFSVWEIWGALTTGGQVVVVSPADVRDPAAFLKIIVECGVTHLSQTPSAFRRLLAQAGGTVLGAVNTVVLGGEKVTVGELYDILAADPATRPRVYNLYGITEVTVHATVKELSGHDLRGGVPSPIGAPLPDLRFAVLDERRRVVPVGVRGELWIGGVGVARGYVNRPELTAERFVAGLVPEFGPMRWYRTGDTVRELPSGEFEYIGRLDHQVKLRGFRIELGEVEAVLAAHPAVAAAAVELRPGDGPEDGELAAVLEVAPGAELTDDEIRGWLAARLPGYMIPASFRAAGALPVTANGKLDRAALAGLVGEPLRRAAVSEPVTDAEKILQEVWSAVLKVPAVGRNDDFFAIGGDSMLALRLVSACEEAGIMITLRDLFQNPTLSALATAAIETTTPVP